MRPFTEEDRKRLHEDEANYFAVCLMMPRKLLLEDVARLGGVDFVDDAQVRELAARYQVSTSLMAIRLAEVIEDARRSG